MAAPRRGRNRVYAPPDLTVVDQRLDGRKLLLCAPGLQGFHNPFATAQTNEIANTERDGHAATAASLGARSAAEGLAGSKGGEHRPSRIARASGPIGRLRVLGRFLAFWRPYPRIGDW
jgi:hypothetical protein